jgi:hypothetical protein
LDEIQKVSSLEEFMQLGTEMGNTGQLPDKWTAAILGCLQ